MTLRQLGPQGRFVRVKCDYCRSATRFYHPDDLAILLGDVEVDQLRRRLKCERCGRRDYVEVDAPYLTGPEMRDLIVRRLVRVRTIRRPIWREERL
ncbi:hypothetical protein ABRA89_03410 [Fulvimarina sp. MAC8]